MMLVNRSKLSKHARKSFKQILKFLQQQINLKRNLDQYRIHLIVGAPQVGKTTLLARSQLDFRFHKKLAHSQQHQSINWWLTHDQIYLDLPGQAVMNEKQCAGWLKLIKQSGLNHRIASCCWVMRAQDIEGRESALANQEEWLNFARMSRQILGQVPSMQLVITQCDQIPGFQSYFGLGGDSSTSQPLGYSLPTQWGNKAIEQSHQQLLSTLSEQLVERLRYATSTHDQLAAKDFVCQFQQFLEQLEINLSFLKNQGCARQALTGVFFTGYGEKHYLFNDALLKHVLPKQSVIIPNKLTVSLIKWLCVVSLLLLAAGTTLIAWRLQTVSQSIKSLETDLQHYQALQQDATTSQDRLQSIRYLKRAKNKLTTLQQNKWLTIYNKPMNKLQHKIQHANQQLANHLRPILQKRLEKVLRNPDNPAVTYACLATYLMLNNQMPLDESYIKRVINYLQHADKPYRLSAVIAKAIQHRLLTNSSYFVRQHNFDARLVHQLKQQFNELSALQKANVVLDSYFIDRDPLTLTIPRANDDGFQLIQLKDSDVSIKPKHTRQAWQYLNNHHLWLRSVLTITQGNAIARSQSSPPVKQLAQKLKQHYLKQYAQDWDDFRSNIILRQPHTIKQVQQALQTEGRQQSSLMGQLASLFYNQVPGAVRPFLESKTQSLIHSIEAQDDAMHDFKQLLQDLRQYIAGADQPHKAYKISYERMLNSGKGDALDKLNNQMADIPTYWRGWSKKLTTTVWQLLLKQSADYINQQWQDQVWPDYKHQLQNRYPFNRQANQDVKPVSFKHLFAPHQVMMHFYHNYLQAFVDTHDDHWRYRSLDGEHLPLSQHTLELFKQSHTISDKLFDKHNNLCIDLGIQLSSKATKIRNMQLQWAKQTLRLSVPSTNDLHHMQQFSWCYNDNQPKLKVFYQMANGDKQTKEYEGFWGVWRWLSHYQSEPIKTHYWRLQGQSDGFKHKLVLHFASQHPMFDPKYFQNLPFRRRL